MIAPPADRRNVVDDPTARLLGRLVAVRQLSGAKWLARCPAHDDGVASLSIDRADDGRVLVHCFAGCPTADVVAAAGLRLADLFESSRGRPREVNRWDVRDGSGRVVAVLARLEPGLDGRAKSYCWYGPDGRTKGLHGLAVTALPLYGADRVAASVELCVTEGAKAADAVRDAGVPAVATLTGAAKVPAMDSLCILQGHPIVLWPDYDVPGRDHMVAIASLLLDLVPSVRVVTPDSAWAPGADAADLAPLERRHRVATAVSLKPMSSQDGEMFGQEWTLPPIGGSLTRVAGPTPTLIRPDAPELRLPRPGPSELAPLLGAYRDLQRRPVSRPQQGLLEGCYRVHGADAVSLLHDLYRERGSLVDLLVALRHHEPRHCPSAALPQE